MRLSLIHSLLFALIFVTGRPPAGPPPPGLQTDADYEVEALVRDIFVTGVCDNLSNVQAIGHEGGIGYFESGGEVIGLDRGIILSTGPVGNAQGPNDLTDASGDFSDTSGDADLNLMATGQVRDAVGIEFDFVPLDSFVTFRYVFASEEYCEFVGSIYNDVFGFFISGPGIEGDFADGAENVALIPGTDDYVAINDVNHASNPQYFIRNELPDDAAQCGLSATNWPARDLIQYDGFTRQLTARLKLSPCETYHIRLVVADVGDAFYDSAVFLEAGSFNIGSQVTIDAPTVIATEGCNDGYFRFTRGSDSEVDFPLTVNYALSPAGTAEAGLDFEPFSGQITIPAGAMEADLPVFAFNDQLTETPEQLTLVLDIPCACYTDSATLIIQDSPELWVELPDAAFCGNSQTTLQPEVAGGNPPYSYLWDTGDTGPVLMVSPPAPRAYVVTVSDACGNVAVDSCWVDITDPPQAWLSGEETVCAGDTAWLPVAMTGAPPWELQYQVDGVPQPPLTGITDSDFQLPVTLAGVYELAFFQDAYCVGDTEGSATVELTRIELTLLVDGASCAGASDGAVSVEVAGGTPPYAFEWGQGLGEADGLSGLGAGVYTLLVTDAAGCRETVVVEVPAPPPLEEVTFDCEDLADGLPALSAAGGTPPYQYSTDGEYFLDAAIFDELTPGGSYALVIRDANDCRLDQSFIMPAVYERMVDLAPELHLKLGETVTLEPVLNLPTSLIAGIRWLPDADLSCGDCLTPELTAREAGVFTIRVTDLFGCVGEASVRVRIDPGIDVFIPNAFSPNGDEVNDQLTVFANELQVRRILSLQVYDRWGGQVYTGGPFLPNNERVGWDGFIRGRPADAGLYVYFVRLELVDGSTAVRKGEVLLVR